MKNMYKQLTVLILAILLVLVGCNSSPSEVEVQVKLKVLTWNKDSFYERYGKWFNAVHPRYELDIVSVYDHMERSGANRATLVTQLLEAENPDVLVLPMNEFAKLKDEGRLQALAPWLKKDSVDVAAFAPAVMNYMKDEQQAIYGFAPVFTGKALYYNKQLFAVENIPLPSGRMTWGEVFSLAERFTSTANSGTIGLYHPQAGNPYLMALYVGEGSGLSLYQENAITLHTEAWTQVFHHVIACVQSGSCADGRHKEIEFSEDRGAVEKANMPFLAGNVAMAVEDSRLFRTIVANPERYGHLDWGIIPYPASEAHPELGNVAQMEDVFAIPVDAPQAEHAWALIHAVSSEEYASLLPQLNPSDLPTRMSDDKDSQLQVFYELERTTNGMAESLRKLPYEFLLRMDELAPMYMEMMLSGQEHVGQVLQALEAELQAAYDMALRNQES